MKKPTIILLAYLCSAALFAQEKTDFDAVQQYVAQKLQKWEVRGKFESTEEYEERISLMNRKSQIDTCSFEALQRLAPQKINWIGNITVGDYNADKGTFELILANAENLLLTVPASDAPTFKKEWKDYYLRDVQYGLYKQKYAIYAADIIVNNKLYPFSAPETTTYGNEVWLSLNGPANVDAQNVSTYAKVVKHIKENIDKYMVKGEFEKPEEYEKRIAHENVEAKERQLAEEALAMFGPQKLKPENINLGYYSADFEMFPLEVKDGKKMQLPVPISVAKDVKTKWDQAVFDNVKYGLYGSDAVFSSFDVIIGDMYFKFNATENAPDYGKDMKTHIDLDNVKLEYLDYKTYEMIAGGDAMKNPPLLTISEVTFVDQDQNKRIDADEKAKISFKLSNTGKGVAYNMSLRVTEKNDIANLQFTTNGSLGNLGPGEHKMVEVPISAGMELKSGRANFRVEVLEENKFDADPLIMNVEIKEFQAPNVVLYDYKFVSDGGGKIELGKTAVLKAVIQNSGLGTAKNINVKFILPPNVKAADKSTFEFDKLLPNEAKAIDFEFLPNKRFTETEISVEVNISEQYGKYGDVQTPSVSLAATLMANTIRLQSDTAGGIATNISLTSDIDKDIPKIDTVYNNRYAWIVGNEDYAKYQQGGSVESNVDFARADAISFKQYAQRVLGIPERKIRFKTDAQRHEMLKDLSDLVGLIKAEEGNAEVFVYYAGHGFPDDSKEPYIMPVDIGGQSVNNGINLSELYSELTKYPSKQVTVFIDACFSGGGRNQGLMAGTRGVKVKPKEVSTVGNNLVVFSACSGEEISHPYKSKYHGMFTYFLLKELKESKGQISYKELYEEVAKNVKVNSLIENKQNQTPLVKFTTNLTDTWETIKLVPANE